MEQKRLDRTKAAFGRSDKVTIDEHSGRIGIVTKLTQAVLR